MFAFGKTCFSASRRNGLINNFGMSICRYNLLCNQYFVADRTMFAFGKSRFGTRRRNCRINNFGMSERSDLLIGRVVTTRASVVGVPTNLGTSRRLCVVMYKVMTECGKRFILGIGVIVIGRRVNLYARFRASSRLSHFTRYICIAQINVGFILGANVFCLRGKAVPHERVKYIGMDVRIDLRDYALFNVICVVIANTSLQSFFFHGGFFYDSPLAPIVTERRDFLIGRIVAARTSIVCVPTDCSTSCRLCVVMYKVVTECGKRFILGIGVTIIIRRVNLYARFRASSCLSHFVCNGSIVEYNMVFVMGAYVFRFCGETVPNKGIERIFVLKRRYLLISREVATRARDVSVPTNLGASRRFGVVTNYGMTERFDRLIGGVVATRASVVGVPTNLGTSRRLCVVMNKVVTECRDFLISSVVATRASIVSVPTDYSAGRRLRVVVYEVVSERGDHGRFKRDLFLSVNISKICATFFAYVIRRIPVFGAGRGFCRNQFQRRFVVVVSRRLDVRRHDPYRH